MARIAPDERIKGSLLRHAELFEIESRLIERARARLSESRELLAQVNTLLSTRPVARREDSSVPAGDLVRGHGAGI